MPGGGTFLLGLAAAGVELGADPQALGQAEAVERQQREHHQQQRRDGERPGHRLADGPADRHQGQRDLQQHELLKPEAGAEQARPRVHLDRNRSGGPGGPGLRAAAPAASPAVPCAASPWSGLTWHPPSGPL
ncbi:hypothetical protein GCM10020229_41390 [Kitasatospora albolonga]